MAYWAVPEEVSWGVPSWSLQKRIFSICLMTNFHVIAVRIVLKKESADPWVTYWAVPDEVSWAGCAIFESSEKVLFHMSYVQFSCGIC